MAINLPGEFIDIRQPIRGDSFGWAGLEPAPAKKVIIIHATASEDAHEDGFTMADFHVLNRGWDGIGVHFVCTKDSYPGRAGVTPSGAHIQYVGDLMTWRAGVANNNPGRVHIEISGLFTPGHGVPSEGQLRAVRHLIDFLLAPNNILPSLNYYSQVDFHNHQATPGNGTACPGWEHPQFNEWFHYLQGGPEPSWWHPAPAPQPVPVVVTPPVAPADNRPEWEKTWNPTPLSSKVVAVPSADVVSFPQNKTVKTLPGNELVKDIAGTFTVSGQEYVQTAYSASKNLFNGILLSNLKDYVAPGQGGFIDGIQAPVAADLGGPLNHEEPPAPVAPAPTVAVLASEESQNVLDALHALGEWLLGILSSPLRLVGIINNLIKR